MQKSAKQFGAVIMYYSGWKTQKTAVVRILKMRKTLLKRGQIKNQMYHEVENINGGKVYKEVKLLQEDRVNAR